MLLSSIPIKLLLSIILGAAIGLERGDIEEEKKFKNKFEDIGGVRVFSLISLLGGVAGILSSSGDNVIYLLIFSFFLLTIVVYHAISSLLTKSTSLTSELSAVFTFIIGYFITSEVVSLQLAITLTVVLSLILTLKEKVASLYTGLSRKEISAFLSFALIALVILPFLPNQTYFLADIPGFNLLVSAYNLNLGFIETLDIFNPFRLWFLVALVTGIEVIGYIANKLAGEKGGTVLSSAVGGFVSATTVIFSLAGKSKKLSNPNQLLGAAMFSNMTSNLPYFLLIAPLNSEWLVSITLTLLIIIVTQAVLGYYFLRKYKKNPVSDQ